MQPLHSFPPLLAAMVLIVCSATAAADETSLIAAASDDTPHSASNRTGNTEGSTRRWEIPAAPIGEFGQALDPGALAGLRGGYDSAENSIVVDGIVDGNTANGVVGGTNTISDGAFANANGLSTVIQNSGSNVLIQNAMIVKVDFGGAGP